MKISPEEMVIQALLVGFFLGILVSKVIHFN